MASRREVVITGTGIASPIGIGNDAAWASIEAGQSGVGAGLAVAGGHAEAQSTILQPRQQRRQFRDRGRRMLSAFGEDLFDQDDQGLEVYHVEEKSSKET